MKKLAALFFLVIGVFCVPFGIGIPIVVLSLREFFDEKS
jgi:hypothetical protein